MGDFNLGAGDPVEYAALVGGLGGATAVRDLFVEEHGGNASRGRATAI
jgi:hypothetical protein